MNLWLVLALWLSGAMMTAVTVMTMLVSNSFRAPSECTRPHGEVRYEHRRGLGLPYAIAEISKDSVPFYRARHAVPEPGAGLTAAGRRLENGSRVQTERSLL